MRESERRGKNLHGDNIEHIKNGASDNGIGKMKLHLLTSHHTPYRLSPKTRTFHRMRDERTKGSFLTEFMTWLHSPFPSYSKMGITRTGESGESSLFCFLFPFFPWGESSGCSVWGRGRRKPLSLVYPMIWGIFIFLLVDTKKIYCTVLFPRPSALIWSPDLQDEDRAQSLVMITLRSLYTHFLEFPLLFSSARMLMHMQWKDY